MSTNTKERPIIMQADMVRAVLEGRKTQTRRVIKPQPLILDSGGAWYPEGKHPKARHYANDSHLRAGLAVDFCPYGRVGDRLWVREAFSLTAVERESGPKVWYRADNNRPTWAERRWRPSIHMPRWASRLTLEITDVRVQRVQEISAADCIAEGVPQIVEATPEQAERAEAWAGGFDNGHCQLARVMFSELWGSISAKRGYGWDANPWVWAITFRRVHASEGGQA